MLPANRLYAAGLGKNLYFTLTVEENLQYFARLFNHDAGERRRLIDMLTRSTGLYDFLDRPAGNLSGGMKQKLGLCCALIHDPELLILDEPTTGVDPLARRQFWELIAAIRRRNPRMSVLAATAYMDEAQKFEYLYAMDDGKILACGTPEKLLYQTSSNNLDEAFIKLLPEEKRSSHHRLSVPPLPDSGRNDIAIMAKNLTKKFGSFTAVDNVSFQIRRGEIFGFLGSNGCGKTTTMRMLTGLIAPSSGKAELFGKVLDSNSMEIRRHLGYMTQNFSLYNELSVEENLRLYARLCQVPPDSIALRTREMMEKFDLIEYAGSSPEKLPLGIKQRLSLAAAVIHQPDILILDEPTSGVDPVARDNFWELIISLSRQEKVTIFITTHFMNEAERCDRISLMHAGKSLVCDTPEAIVRNSGCRNLEEAFIRHLESSMMPDTSITILPPDNTAGKQTKNHHGFSFQRLRCCAWKELLELLRDPIRAVMALFGALLLMTVMGYGISMDVEELSFAVLDRDQSQLSRNYALNISGSRYFIRKPPVKDYADLDRRMKNGQLSMAVELPPGFGKKLQHGDSPEVAVWVDGAMPMRSETINGYINAMHRQWLAGNPGYHAAPPVKIEVRFRYNPDVLSLPAMVPGVIPVLLIMLPSTLAALAVVREKESGSIINFYVTPLTRTEFLLGKQLPYVGFAVLSAALMLVMATTAFDVPVKGSWLLLLISLVLYCIISTGMGLLASSVTRSQIAVIFLTMLATMLPATQLCGLINPVSTQQGLARVIGTIYPTTYMLLISRGVFNKALGFVELGKPLFALVIMIPIITFLGVICQKKQES